MMNGGIIKVHIQRHSSDSIKISFIDQGYGISKERIRNIGEPFYSAKEMGTGLGLMVSHKNVQEYGGAIKIKSKVHKGTTVDVILSIEHQYWKKSL